MSACRYEQGPCTFPTALRRHFRCQDGSCPEQVGRWASTAPPETKPTISETKPAAPAVARKEEEMPKSKNVGTCPDCGKDKPLYGARQVCMSCVQRAARGGKPAVAPAPTPSPAAPKPTALTPIAQQRPVQPASAGLSLTFRVTLEPGLTAGAAAEILATLPAGAVLVG